MTAFGYRQSSPRTHLRGVHIRFEVNSVVGRKLCDYGVWFPRLVSKEA
jgi:hypothetical protein